MSPVDDSTSGLRSGGPKASPVGSEKRWGSVDDPVTVSAPAKLTLSLVITQVREDGYHLIDAEMVSVDLADTLTFEAGIGLSIVNQINGGLGLGDISAGPANLVRRALDLMDRRSSVRLVKRIPPGAGLGGGSADAAAVLRWARLSDLDVAVRLGADVPFCLVGGRARVTGIGEYVEPLPFADRRFLLLLPPLSVDTAAVYRAWDRLHAPGVAGGVQLEPGGHNDLESAALGVAPNLAHWRDILGDATGRRPQLAGSGSSWFVEGTPDMLGIDGRDFLVLKGVRAPLVAVRTVPPLPTL